MSGHVEVLVPTDGAALERQTAEFVAWERRRRAEADRFYSKYEELIGRHREVGTRWAREFDPVEHAGYSAWRSREVGDIPLMPVE